MRMVMSDSTNAPSVRSARRAQRSRRGQTLVEVGLTLPIFLLTLLAVIEFGWFSAVAAATTSASREAARFGSTVGETGLGDPHYIDCPGIRAAARATTQSLIQLSDLDIEITYDDGATAKAVPCQSNASRPAKDDLERWDRVVVKVTVEYSPLVPLLEPLIGTHDLVSIDRRSIGKP